MLNNTLFLALFVFLTSCFASNPSNRLSAGRLLVNGTVVFLGVLQIAMAEKTGNGFCVGSVID